jgi:DNA transposition AAA+ family ATPase
MSNPAHDTRERFATLPVEQPEDRSNGVGTSIQAEASSAHSRINVPFNLNNWKNQPQEIVDELMWFHQWLLDKDQSWDDACKAISADRSTVFRILKGTYQAKDWMPIMKRIKSFRKLQAQRAEIQQSKFVPNRITKMISAGLDYAMANNSICLVIGESRLGKTEAFKDWKERNNHGRTVMVEVPPQGGPKAVLLEIAKSVGVNQNLSVAAMQSAVVRAFNEHRMLLVDEVHRTISHSRTANPITLETIRYIKDRSGCSVGMSATQRFSQAIEKSHYQYEQIIGRIGMPILLPHVVIEGDIIDIVTQYIPEPTPKLIENLLVLSNRHGRFGVMTETLKFASRIASKAGKPLSEGHVFDAISIRRKMQGQAVDLFLK